MDEAWRRFEVSGKISDYLKCKNVNSDFDGLRLCSADRENARKERKRTTGSLSPSSYGLTKEMDDMAK